MSNTLLATQAMNRGAGFRVRALHGPKPLLDPFIGVDRFRMAEPVFGPHPHAGFSAVTYLFADSETGFVSRDSLGGEHAIAPGGLHWTLAGRGVMHDEFPTETGRFAHGLQIFVNLPAAQKLRPPEVLKLGPAQMPRRRGAGFVHTQVFGASQGLDAALPLPWPTALAIVELEAGATLDWALPEGEQGFAIVGGGSGRVGAHVVADTEAATLVAGGVTALAAGAERFTVALFSGRPLAEPLVQHGPFGMSDELQIAEAIQRWQAGGMGRLAPVPPPPRATELQR